MGEPPESISATEMEGKGKHIAGGGALASKCNMRNKPAEKPADLNKKLYLPA